MQYYDLLRFTHLCSLAHQNITQMKKRSYKNQTSLWNHLSVRYT